MLSSDTELLTSQGPEFASEFVLGDLPICLSVVLNRNKI